MIYEKRILIAEFTVLILLWIFAFVSPVLFMDDFNQNWMDVHIIWVECALVGVLFLINRFVLLPRLFFAKKYTVYVISLIALLFVLAIFIIYFDGLDRILALFGEGVDNHLPMRRSMSPYNRPPYHSPHINGLPPSVTRHTGSALPPTISILIQTLIVVTLDLGLSIAVKWLVAEQKQAEVNRERVNAQLSNLQSQVSPHFFMNTLNNIHALVEIDPERAQKTIIELSGLMDYLLYESSNLDRVLLQRELDFIASYINLMRLRYPERVKIDFFCSDSIPAIKIPPLLFLNFIENTFKYGVDYTKASFIKIAFTVSESEIEMTTKNSNHSSTVSVNRRGIGISNSRKRLKLLYGNQFSLDIDNGDETYCVTLKIPII
ncbi:MAG: sensor histidine kinase [Rikenellaceae bacterium]